MLLRKGACKQCGECCRWVKMAETPKYKVDQKLVEFRKLMVVEHGLTACLYAYSPCPQLGDDGKCKQEGEKAPSCIGFPWRPEDLLPGCGFWFE